MLSLWIWIITLIILIILLPFFTAVFFKKNDDEELNKNIAKKAIEFYIQNKRAPQSLEELFGYSYPGIDLKAQDRKNIQIIFDEETVYEYDLEIEAEKNH